MQKRKYISVYQASTGLYYVRLVAMETKRFPHGVSLATDFPSKSLAEKFADEVEEYIKQFVKGSKKK